MAVTMHRTDAVLINRLSRLMGERRMTIQDVADGTGLSRRTLHDIYHAKSTRIDLDTLNRLCAFFDVTAADIFEWRRGPDDPAPTAAKAE
jgi:putative transcriptional regulator